MSVRTPSNSTDLSADERALFLRLLAEEEIAFTPVEVIPRRAPAADAPLSFAQQRLWFLDQLIPNSSLYNVPIAVRLQGRLDVDALERSLNEIVKRHEVLRTTFSAVDERPVQTINSHSSFLLPIIDLQKFPPPAREAHVRSLAAAEAQRPFDLSRDRLLRARLLRLGTFDHVVLLTMHHISSDGWSMRVLVKEVAALYRAYSPGHESPLAELPIQYADYAVWQRQWLQGDVLESQLAYWKQRLADAPPVLDLPFDRPRPLVQSHRGAMRSIRLSRTLSTALTDLGQQRGVTLFMTLLAAFQVLLARYTRQDDILVATPVAGRNRAELEGLIGFFVNTLVLRTDLSGNPSFAELLKRVREVALEAYAHQDVPFERLVEELQPDRDLSSNTLFQVMMVLQNANTATLQLPELTLSLLENECLTSRFDLTLYVGESSDGLSVSFEYSTDLFEPQTIDRMLRHYELLLEGVTVDPDRRLSELELLTNVERKLMLVEWNDTATAWHTHSFISLFEHQVKQTPDALAVEFGDQQLSYRELNRRANQLAHYLRNNGVGVDARVGISLERSCEMVIAVLAVLKAGGCYVPLDPAYPAERLNFMVEDAQCAMVLTRETVTARLLASESDEDPQIQIDPENLAFLIYTSGSTGRPKGVAMTQRALSNLINWHATRFREPARTLQFASFSFDVSFQEMFSTWCSGGTLLLVNEDLRRDPKAMRRYLADQQAERIFLPFVYLQHLAEAYAEDGTPPASLQEIVALGERLEITTQIASLCERTQCPLHNHYGPTETHVMVAHTLNGKTDRWPRLPPIGRPISNTEVYILDHALQPVPIGVAGEVYLGGECLSRGYWQRPDLTAERYISNPFGDAPGTRLYRTGDLGRYLNTGEIEFLGRCDTQVKIRGYRIELGEIEATLRKHPRVLHAVVIDKDDRPGYRRLIAYVVPKGDSAPASAELNGYLQTQLPDYMLPAAWVMLEELPLTASGKLHRSALPEPESVRLGDGQALLAPRTIIEEMVAGIWEHVLGIERVNRNDNFFWLGGHSLLATRVVSRLRDVFQVDVQVRSLFESPTIVELSEHIEELIRTGGGRQAPALRPRANDEHLPLSYAQQRLWFLEQLLPGSNAYNLPAEMELDAGLNITALEQSLSEVIRRHEALRTTFTFTGRQPVQHIKPARVEQLPLVDLLNLSAQEREATLQRLRQEDALRPFDLAAGPLVRTRLIRVEEHRHVFLLNKHHIVSDGWSVGVLMHDMDTLYKAFARGCASPLPELKIQYADYALWQRDWLQGDLLQEEVNFWKQQLEGAPTLLELETDHPRQLLRSLRGTHCPVSFSKEVSHSLREFSRHEGATLFMTLMAGFHALLWRYTGQNDILVGTPTAGRSRIDLEPMIGFFVNMIPIRTRFREAPTFRQLVKQVRESAFVAYAHQDLPFDRLVEELQPKRAPGRNPIFQAILALQNDAPEMEMAKVSVPAGVPARADVKFDLEVHLRDTWSGVNGVFVYSPELFEPSLIARMVNHFQRLFEQALAEPDVALSSLSLLDEAEYRQVVHEWNDTAAAFPDTACTHHIFEQHVQQQPDAIALEFGDEQLSYHVLNQRANLLAQQLRREGVGPEVFVGVMLPRSAELIVAMLAAVKAGGAYVPINLNDPQKRIEFVWEDAGVKVVVTTKQIALDLTERDLTLLYVDALRDEPVADVKADSSSENLVYLMYTSGSTGTPKGVCITHRNVVALIKSGYFPDLNSQDIFMHFAPVSFDGSTFEIWGGLLNGTRLVIFPPLMPSVSELVDFIKQTQVTRMFLTTGLFHQVVEANVRSLGAVKQLLTGGDVLSSTHVNRAVDQMDDFSLVNIYGPTETTVMSCCYEIGPERPASSVPIGRPIPNTRIYVLNSMQPAGAGERGELFIAGAGVGRGYHNRPALTAERYLPDPFGAYPGGRLYKTGDIARYLSNGDLKFLGRIDNQVKISGYRIELTEIEAVLSEHPAVIATAVVATEVGPGDKRLVAYMVQHVNGGPAASTEELKRYLKERLPTYMVPSTFVMLEALPLTPHGKLDRAALPAPQVTPGTDREYVAPRNDLQRQLVEIWEELFKFQPIGVTDNFFELGGHSLLLIMLVARIEERLGKRVVIADLFSDPTIERLSELIGHGKEKLFQPLLVPLQTHGSKPALFSPHAGRGHVWCYQDLARYTGDDQPFYGIQARQPETGLVAHTQIEAMAVEYVGAIRSFQANGPYLLCGWSMGGVIAFEMARQLQHEGQQIALLALIDSYAPNGQQSNYHWADLLLNFARDVGLIQENRNLSGSAAVSQVSQLREVWKEAKSNSLIPSDMTLVEFRKEFDVFKTNANIATSYQPGDYAGRITLFRTDNLSLTSTELLNGWDKLALGGVDLHTVPGDHFSMIKEPHVKVLAEELRDCIRKAL